METFMTEYAKQLDAAVRDYPQEYRSRPVRLPEVLTRMRVAIEKGGYSKDSRAFKATCKAPGIKHTYKAIRHFIDNHV